jgi:hypothetical protein
MLVYKCDGDSYSTGKKCGNEAENELPERWLSISGKIKNGLYDAHYIECNGVRHFCSRRCLENFLFKDVIPLADSPALNTMNNFDPNAKQAEQEAAGAAEEAKAENTANEQATEQTEGDKAAEE